MVLVLEHFYNKLKNRSIVKQVFFDVCVSFVLLQKAEAPHFGAFGFCSSTRRGVFQGIRISILPVILQYYYILAGLSLQQAEMHGRYIVVKHRFFVFSVHPVMMIS